MKLAFSALSIFGRPVGKTLFLGLILSSAPVFAKWHTATEAIMGTEVSAQFWLPDTDGAKGEKLTKAVMQLMHDVDQQMSPYITSSELYQINEKAAKTPVSVSENLFALLKEARHVSELSNGAFDITYASVGHLYNYKTSQQPSDDAITKHLPAINYKHIVLNEKDHTVTFTQDDVKIDLGGIAKGYAVDTAIELLKQNGVDSAAVSAGGDTRVIGNKGNKPWMFGIQHPRDKTAHAVILPLSNTAISTSGDYERFFLEDGERVHHIINPSNGKSAGALQSASVLAPTATQSDALSTTVFVLGVKKGLALINELPGVDAIIIDNKGKLHYSDDLLMQSQ